MLSPAPEAIKEPAEEDDDEFNIGVANEDDGSKESGNVDQLDLRIRDSIPAGAPLYILI